MGFLDNEHSVIYNPFNKQIISYRKETVYVWEQLETFKLLKSFEYDHRVMNVQPMKDNNLMIFTEYGNKHLTGHAMKSLKNAMSWDEEKYGLEYDLKSSSEFISF